MKKNNDYWFTIEPYTYVYFQKNEMLFFNTLDGSILKTRNKSVIKLVKDTLSETNLSVSYLSNIAIIFFCCSFNLVGFSSFFITDV